MQKSNGKQEQAAARPHSPELLQIDEQAVKVEPRRDLFEQLLDDNTCETALPSHHHHHHSPHSHCHHSQMIDQQDEHPGCKCSKIDCLKLYCECFAKGRKCNRRCICVGCHNHPGREQSIYKAQMIANFRKPGHFQGIPAFVPTRRCTCKKSSCQKNYCQCYRAGVKCGDDCECSDCRNGKPHHHYPYFSQSFRMESETMHQITSVA